MDVASSLAVSNLLDITFLPIALPHLTFESMVSRDPLVGVLFIVALTTSLEPTPYGIMTDNMVCFFYVLIACYCAQCFLFPGLIRFKIVIHAFVDGKSRYVVGIQANNNNRAQTVLDLFLSATAIHGVPSRVRGDHGTENLRVAEWMEENHGLDRGSYIWGR